MLIVLYVWTVNFFAMYCRCSLHFDKGCNILILILLSLSPLIDWEDDLKKQDQFDLPQKHLSFDQPIRIHIRLTLHSFRCNAWTIFSRLSSSVFLFERGLASYEISSSTEDDAYKIEFYISWWCKDHHSNTFYMKSAKVWMLF